MFLLDTNIVSELRRAKPHGGVLAWIKSVDAERLYLAAATLGELQSGAEKVRRHDPARAGVIDTWIDLVMKNFDVLSVDGATFRLWAKLMRGKPTTFFADTLIAAVAMNKGLTIATRNVHDFQQFAVEVFNPFEFKTTTGA